MSDKNAGNILGVEKPPEKSATESFMRDLGAAFAGGRENFAFNEDHMQQANKKLEDEGVITKAKMEQNGSMNFLARGAEQEPVTNVSDHAVAVAFENTMRNAQA